MKRTAILPAILYVLLCATGVCQAADIIQFQTGVNFDWWDDNRIEQARQLLTPISITSGYKELSVSVLTAYADTHLDTPSEHVGLSNFLDTKLMTSYLVAGKLPVDILLGLDLNLPTGKTNLSRRQLDLIMDPDLISVNNFGEGFDVNPTVSVAKQWGNWVGGIGLGYLWRGSYDFCSEIGLTDFRPGQIYSASSELRYYFSPAMHARLFGKHAWYGKDTLKGKDFFQQGDFTLFGAGFDYSKKNKWHADATFRGIYRDKSKFQQSAGVLATEAHDLEGDEYVLDLSAKLFLNEKTALRPYFQGRYFTKNDYPAGSDFLIGKREKASLGAGVTRALTRRIDAVMDVRVFVKHDDVANFPLTRSSRDYQGISFAAQLAGSF